MQREVAAFSNPIAPERGDDQRAASAAADAQSVRLTNADFRKLLMTPRVSGPQAGGSFAVPKTPAFSNEEISQNPEEKAQNSAQKRRHFLPKSKREELERQRELDQRYRDRARERRDHEKTGDEEMQEYFDESGNVNINLLQTRSEYRAVPSDVQLSINAQERRKQLIQESKYLGGDMEHTHLVKGLDFALLEKVKGEIEQQDREVELAKLREHEAKAAKNDSTKRAAANDSQKPRSKSNTTQISDTIECHSATIRRILHAVFDLAPPERNELFSPGRMSYVFELDDADGGDLPIAVIRSKAELALVNTTRRVAEQPAGSAQSTQSTNDIVLEKLVQILHGLRTGKRDNAGSKRGKTFSSAHAHAGKKNDEKPKGAAPSMFDDDVGEYVPELHKRSTHDSGNRSASGRRYFESEPAKDRDRDRDRHKDEDAEATRERDEDEQESTIQRFKMRTEIDCYVECYPGMAEMDDALVDSDEEDNSKKANAAAAKNDSSGRKRFDKTRPGASGFFIAPTDEIDNSKDEAGFHIASSSSTQDRDRSEAAHSSRTAKKERTGEKKERNERAALDREWAQIQAIMDRKSSDGKPKARRDREDDDDEPAERREKRAKVAR